MLEDVYFSIVDLANGNLLLNAVGGAAGNDAKLSVPAAALGEDEILSINESFTISTIFVPLIQRWSAMNLKRKI